MKQIKHLWLLTTVAATILLAVLIFWQPTPTPADFITQNSSPLSERPQGGDFSLTSLAGRFDSADYRGKVLLIYFGYTFCPDICPTNLAILTQALNELNPEELAQVQTIFISVDPERDTLQRLSDYTRYFHPSIIGMTGTPEEVAKAAKLFGAAYENIQSGPATGYLVDHSAYTYVVDQKGHLVQSLDHASAPEKVLAVIRNLLDRNS